MSSALAQFYDTASNNRLQNFERDSLSTIAKGMVELWDSQNDVELFLCEALDEQAAKLLQDIKNAKVLHARINARMALADYLYNKVESAIYQQARDWEEKA